MLNQKIVFKAILKLSKNNSYVAIQELDYLGIPRPELVEILKYFESNRLLGKARVA